MVGSSKGSDTIHLGDGDDVYYIFNNLDVRDSGIPSNDVNYIYDSSGTDTITILNNPGPDSYRFVNLEDGEGGFLIELTDGAQHIFTGEFETLRWIGDANSPDLGTNFDIVFNVEDIVGGETVFAGTDGDDIVDLTDTVGGTGENVSSWSKSFSMAEMIPTMDLSYLVREIILGAGFLVYGGAGDGVCTSSQDSNIGGGAGDDFIQGGAGDDELGGGLAETILSMAASDDTICGGGDDIINDGGGDDYVDAGDGMIPTRNFDHAMNDGEWLPRRSWK